jgi:hypothetical protein
VLARTQFLYSNATDSDDYVFVEPGNYYLFTPTIGGFKLGLADVTVDANIMWVAQPGKSIFIHIPANEEYLHFDGLIPGSRGYLRKLTGKEDETSTNMWNQLFPNLVAYYRMDDNADNKIIVDSMGYSDGTAIQNTEDIHVDGKINGALSFNGTSDYVDTNNTFKPVLQCQDSNGITISFQAKPTNEFPNYEPEQILLGSYQFSPTYEFAITLNSNGSIYVYFGAPSGGNQCSSPIVFKSSVTNFHYITVILEKTLVEGVTFCTIYIYFDGVLVKESDEPSVVMFAEWDNNQNLYIGAGNDDGTAYSLFSGSLDDLMIFNRVLIQEEITFLYERGGK